MKTKRARAGMKPAAVSIRRMLVPVDFSAASNRAVEYARRISALTEAQLIFLHVVLPDASFGCEDVPLICADELKENAQENLRALVRSGENNGTSVSTCLIRAGLPAHEIVGAAQESDVDLIVIATHSYTGWRHFCIGSTAERVVRAAPCSVLVVREKERDFAD